MSKISERFSEAMQYKGLNNAFISKKYNISRQLVNNFFTNQKTLTDTLAIVCNGENINLNWLLIGKGEMFISEDIVKTSDNYSIDLLNVRAGAGEGIYNYVIETVDTISLDKSFFRSPINTNKVKGICVDGDSMEPTLRDGDYVLIDENINFGTNGIYAIQYGGQILIKRLQFKMDGTIIIISDNEKYDREIFNPSENQLPFNIIGIKILSIQK
ncbi:S24 family peptidase [Aliarcobacter butzleri]|uniref:S24 family peptidase n=1 Tax=Aliarcobacter butzleri TaxID=28197 RepID=UPI00125FD8B6|nr:S24 family peptidase [Aliarcobacter butzleri]MCG3665474.1 S24 family peptidase [Aliarcobacter butzleri]MDN5079571.1 S24 family peptidase [Aliarcobacter butzleri]